MPGKNKILFFVIITAIVGSISFYNYQKTVKMASSPELVSPIVQNLLLESATKVRSWFYEGDWDEHFKSEKSACPNLLADKYQADVFYYRCNPTFLECIFQSKNNILNKFENFTVKVLPQEGGHTTSFLGKQSSLGESTPNNSTQIKIGIEETGHYLNFSLENDCHDIYLPKRVYSYFRKTSDVESLGPENQFLWDNFNTKVYLDKFLVRWRDIKDWLRADKFLKIKNVPAEVKKWHLPAIGLSKIQMGEYCAFRGKQLMQSHFFDAATVLPGDMSNKKDFFLKHYYYPWTIRDKDTFVYQYVNDPNYELEFNKKTCSRIFSSECVKTYKLNIWSTGFSSWAEFRQILGGELEYLQNPLLPDQNLKASSKHFPLESAWHKLGVRAYWDGDKIIWSYPDGRRGRIRFYPPENNVDDKIGFRCMKYVK